MSLTKTQTKILTFDEALDKTLYICKILANKQCDFTQRFMPEVKKFRIIATKDADNIKVYFPEFRIEQDDRKARYCELNINYG